MGYDRNKVIALAKSEVGYHEKASNAYLDDKTANSGSGNYTKYARDLDALGNFYNGPKQGFAYCDVFVDWLFYKCFGLEAALELLCQPKYSCGAGCLYSAQYYKQKNQFYPGNSIPQVGDQIFFTYQAGEVSHTGIVVSIDGSVVTTIEGNTSDGVYQRTYSVGQSIIYGYGRPNWGSVETVKPASTVKTSPYTVGKTNEETIFNFCIEVLHLNQAAACGVIANIEKESGFRTDAVGDGGTSYGICQWHASRYSGLMNWCQNNGKNYMSLDGQLWYLEHELKGSHSYVYTALKDVPNTAEGAYQAGYQWCMKFEVPADTKATSEFRADIAQSTYWPRYSDYSVSEFNSEIQTAASKPVKTYQATLPELSEGMVGSAVKSLQMLLIGHGYYCGGLRSGGVEVPDGEFGPSTKRAVQEFQTIHQLEPDGVVGEDTMTALLS